MDLELQQRSVEYSSVFTRHANDFRSGLFACMPVFKPSSTFLSEGDDAAALEGQGDGADQEQGNGAAAADLLGGDAAPSGQQPAANNDAMTLLDLLGDSSPGTAPAAPGMVSILGSRRALYLQRIKLGLDEFSN